MHKYKDLIVWNKSIELVSMIYTLTTNYPEKEKFGLISQINRCAVSIPSNIAEGAGRNSQKDFSNFLGIATGSSYELETQIIISSKLGYISTEKANQVLSLIEEIQKMLFSLKKKNLTPTNLN